MGMMGSESGRAVAAMVSLQLLFSALQVFIKLALNDGMDARVLVAYRFMFAATFLCPIAFLRERSGHIPYTTTMPPLLSSPAAFLLLFFWGKKKKLELINTGMHDAWCVVYT